MKKESFDSLRLIATLYQYAGFLGLVFAIIVFLATAFVPGGNWLVALFQSIALALVSLVLIGLHDAILVWLETLQLNRSQAETLMRLETKLDALSGSHEAPTMAKPQ